MLLHQRGQDLSFRIVVEPQGKVNKQTGKDAAEENSPSRLRRQIPLFVAARYLPPAGEVVLGDGAFGMEEKFPAKAQTFRARQIRPLRRSRASSPEGGAKP